MSDYRISVRRGATEGVLKFSGGSDAVTSTCWWNPAKKIPSGRYSGCSATTMNSKRNSRGAPREAIFISNIPGFSGVFIHMGRNASWSDGCIVIPEDKMIRIYSAIKEKNAENVVVVIEG